MLLNKNEIKIYKALKPFPQSVASLVKKTQLPRMTTYTVLLRLKKKGFTKEVLVKGKKIKQWIKSSEEDLHTIFDSMGKSFFGLKPNLNLNQKDFYTYTGMLEIQAELMNLTKRNPGSRMYSIQSSKNFPLWVKKAGMRWVNLHNKEVVKQKLVCFTIHSVSAPSEIVKDKELLDAYKGRLGNSHAIAEDFLPPKVALYVFEEIIFVVDLHAENAIKINSTALSVFIIKLFAYIFTKTDREELYFNFGRT